MGKKIRNFLYLKELIGWIVCSILSLPALGNIGRHMVKDMADPEKDIFWLGVTILILAMLAFAMASITRVVKYYKHLKVENQ